MSSRHRTVLRFVSLLLAVSALAGMARVPNPITTPQVSPSITASPLPHTDVPPLGANFFLEREVESWKREQTLKMAQQAGIRWVKLMFPWEEIEPRKGSFFDEKHRKSTWEKYDEIIGLCEKYGMRIIARLDRPPAWTRRDNRYSTAPPDNLAEYGDFVYAVASRYQGRIQHYQVWNEPNIWPEWGDRPVDAAGYVEMLKIASRRIKEADPNALILSAPLAQTLERSSRNLPEQDYLDGMYQAGAKGFFDILFANAYGFDRPPTDPADPQTLNFSRLLLLRTVMERHGDSGKAVWINEFGWNAAPPNFPPEKLFWQRVSEEEQADYTVQAIRMARGWGWVGVINLWYFRQVGDISPDRSDYYFRVVDTDFTPRPVYHALQGLGREFAVAGPGRHSSSSGAVIVARAWTTTLQPEAWGGAVLAATEPQASLTFTFRGTDVFLIRPSLNSGTRLFITIDGDEQRLGSRAGRRTSSLAAPQDGMLSERVPIAQGLAPGQHTLRLVLEAAGGGTPEGPLATLEAFEVLDRPRWGPFYFLLGVSLVGLLGTAASFLLRRQP